MPPSTRLHSCGYPLRDHMKGSIRGASSAREDELPWSGLPSKALQVALFSLAVAVFFDGVLEAAAMARGGVMSLTGHWDLLGAWDILKTLLIAAALLVTARRSRSQVFTALGLLFLIIGIEDQVALHAPLGHFLASALRIDTWSNLWGVQGSHKIGEFLVLGLFGTLAFLLTWARKRPPLRTLRRARGVLTMLLVLLFFFAGVVDFINSIYGGPVWEFIEETGERISLSLSVAYAVGLVSIKEWWSMP